MENAAVRYVPYMNGLKGHSMQHLRWVSEPEIHRIEDIPYAYCVVDLVHGYSPKPI